MVKVFGLLDPFTCSDEERSLHIIMEKYDTNLLTAAAIGKPNFVVKQIGSVLLLLGMLYHIFEVGFWF